MIICGTFYHSPALILWRLYFLWLHTYHLNKLLVLIKLIWILRVIHLLSHFKWWLIDVTDKALSIDPYDLFEGKVSLRTNYLEIKSLTRIILSYTTVISFYDPVLGRPDFLLLFVDYRLTRQVVCVCYELLT